jgi:hypothetical protein
MLAGGDPGKIVKQKGADVSSLIGMILKVGFHPA